VFMLARDHLRLDAPAFKQQFWDSVLEVLSNRQSDAAVQGKKWLSEDLAQAQSLLIGVLASGVADRWEGFDQSRFLSQKKFKALDANGPDEPADNYPDMYLPTYADLFSNPPLGLVLGLPIPVVQQVDASQAKYAPLRGQSRKGDPQALWINFAPRYKDLGKRPPFEVRAAFGKPEEASNAIARTINDRVEPGFFYWKGSWKDELGAVEKYRNQMEQIRDEALVTAPMSQLMPMFFFEGDDPEKAQAQASAMPRPFTQHELFHNPSPYKEKSDGNGNTYYELPPLSTYDYYFLHDPEGRFRIAK